MKKCLIVVDYQNDFVNGALGFEGAPAIEARIVDLINRYHHQGYDVIFTMDTHDASYLDTEEGAHLPVPHCIEGTEGHQLTEALEAVKTAHDCVFFKHTFPSLELGNHLAKQAYDEIELVGLVSHICVIANAVMAKSACPNAKIIVDAAATASFDSGLHEKALAVMEGLHIHIKNRG